MKKCMLFILALCTSGVLYAQKNPAELMDAAEIILNARAKNTNFSDVTYRSTNITAITDTNNEALYQVVDFDPEGFVILSGEADVFPLIAYSFDNPYPHDIVPHNFNAWMQNVETQIRKTRQENLKADEKIHNAWKNINKQEYWETHKTKAVSPLLHTEWDQGKYYNASCPEDSEGTDGHVVTGCVATALGQLMNYFRHPVQGEGYYSYTDSTYGFLEMDFSEQTYNWDAMGTSLNAYNPDVADLLYHIGISVDMNYGPDASGMHNHKGAYTLRTYFGYNDSTSYLFRDSLDESFDWTGMLIDHLDQHIPVYYAGWGDTVFQSGHAFIADGYQDSTYFHFNWGWGGSADGYFNLNSLTPSGADFTLLHEAIANATPDIAVPNHCEGQKLLTNKQGCLNDGSGPRHNYANNKNCEWLIQPDDSVSSLTFELLEFDTQPEDELIIYDGPDDTAPVLASLSGQEETQSFESNTDKVLVKFISDDTGTDKGWLLSYDSEQPEYCILQTTMTDSTDYISDGSNDYLYNNNTFCNWDIQPEGADYISIQFLEFDVADGDYVRVSDGNTNDIIADFSGSNVPEPMDIQSDKVTVTFRSNNNRAQGWQLKYAMNTSLMKDEHGLKRAQLYPNPASSTCYFEYKNRDDKQLQINISDASGKIAYTGNFSTSPGFNRIKLPVSKLASGLYFVGITTDSSHQVKKLLVK